MATVWVVVSDYGLNSYVVHAVLDYEPTQEEIDSLSKGSHGTGYGGTFAERHIVTEGH